MPQMRRTYEEESRTKGRERRQAFLELHGVSEVRGDDRDLRRSEREGWGFLGMGRTKGSKGTKGTKGRFTSALREEAAESGALHWCFAVGKRSGYLRFNCA